MSGVALDDILAVASQIKLVGAANNPRQAEMLAKLTEPDRSIMQELAKRVPPATLANYLIERSKNPTQTLKAIITALSRKKLEDIDRDHLLINLIHACLPPNEKITPYDVSTLMSHYIALEAIAKYDPSLKSVKFVDCLTPSNPGKPAMITEALKGTVVASGLISKEKCAVLSYVQVTQPSHRILQQAIARTFDEYNDPLQKFSPELLYKVDKAGVPTAYIAPLSITAAIYEQTCGAKDHSVLPIPMFGSAYSYAILRQYSCREDAQEYRPITMPTYLPTSIKQFFYGVRENGLGEVEYDVFSADPNLKQHAKDMYFAHGSRVGIYPVIAHDKFHINVCNEENAETAILRLAIVQALELCMPEKPNDEFLYAMYHNLLDLGVNGFVVRILTYYSKENFTEKQETLLLFLNNIQGQDMKEKFLATFLKISMCSNFEDMSKQYPMTQAIKEWKDSMQLKMS